MYMFILIINCDWLKVVFEDEKMREINEYVCEHYFGSIEAFLLISPKKIRPGLIQCTIMWLD